MVAYRIEPRVDPIGAVVALRRQRARLIVLDARLTIVAADVAARRLLADIDGGAVDRLPGVVESALRTWLGGDRAADCVVLPVPGLVVRAMALDEGSGWVGLLVERVCTRENLEAAARRYGLSRRELDVLRLLLEGDSASQVADRLEIAEYTVGDYIKRLFAKTRVRNRTEMIAKVLGWHALREEASFS